MQRYSDIDFSFKRLAPVHGFRDEKLVSLEESLESIKPPINKLSDYIKRGKRNCHFPSQHGLTRDESAALYIYTMEWDGISLYCRLNQALRSENREALKIWFPYLRLFDSALEKLPSVQEALWRGVSLDVGKNYSRNQLITWWGISSCTSSVNVIKSFLGKGQNSTLFLIQAINGKSIRDYSEFQNEDEIILPLGTQFRVRADPLEQSNGSYIVDLIEINHHKEPPKGDSSGQAISPAHCKVYTRWKQNGTNNPWNRLKAPSGIHIDDDHQCIYVADWGNDCILLWRFNGMNAQVVAGGNGSGNRNEQLKHPSDVFVDETSDSLIICDTGNRRVVRWPRQKGKHVQIIISDIKCTNVTMDHHGNLYTADPEKNEIKRWKIGDTKGTIVAGGNGQGNQLDQLDNPEFIFVDEDCSVYVSDWGNHRVVKWINGAKEGIIVAGGHGKGDSLRQLNCPKGLFVDLWDNVYVVDSANHRVMCWPKGSKEGRIVVGGNGKEEKSNQLDHPVDLSFDRERNLYVSEWFKGRIKTFSIESN